MSVSLGKPLSGIRILDFTRVLAGPLATQQMSDMGAEVIKIEHPEHGDDTRGMRPPEIGGESHFFLAANRNKRSVALDFTKPEGAALVHRLAEKCDVLIENYRKGVMSRRGLEYESMKDRHPNLIYCSISAYGRTSPLADLPGFDPVLQAEAGLMSFCGEKDGDPLRHPLSIIDTYTSLYATQAIMGAIMMRQRTGKGEFIDLALYDVAITVLTNVGLGYLVSGKDPVRRGNEHPTSIPNGLFHSKTGPFYIALGNPRLWKKFCIGVIDKPEWAEEEPFATREGRQANRDKLYALLGEIFATDTREAWLERLIAAGVPGGAVRNVSEALEAPETAARGMVVSVPHQKAGSVRLIASPLKFTETPVIDPVAPPLLGQHTEDVLSELLGMGSAEIGELRRKQVIR
jgi:crotonobetainyl-CoA:carnitine CoA-transferase CaiB-like acyl-CoA transferase